MIQVIKMKIGFFDSGVGGLTVLAEALKQMPNHEYLYYADSKNAPYGVKSKEEVRNLTSLAVDFLINEGAEAIVIACNTATSVTVKNLRHKYNIPIIGIEPALKPALKIQGRVLVTATSLTLQEEKFKNLLKGLDTEGLVDTCALDKLVQLAETPCFDESQALPYLVEKTASLELSTFGSVVLGCTHFPLFKNAFKKLLPHATIVDGSLGVIKRLAAFAMSDSKTQKVHFYISGHQATEKEVERLTNILNHARS